MMAGAAVLLVYWVLVVRGIAVGKLWRRGGAPILRHREPALFYTAAVGMTLISPRGH